MRNSLKVAALLAGLVVVGCNKKEDSTATPPTPPPAATSSNTVTDQVKTATGGLETSLQNAAAGAGANTAVASDAAKTKMQQVVDLIKDKKYDAADAVLKEVEGMKSSLPQAMQDQLPALRAQLDAAKAANGAGITMPSMPK